MRRKEHLEFCTICTLRSFNPNKGIICKLTNEIADFDPICNSFNKDIAQEGALFQKKLAIAGDTDEGDATDFKKNKQQGKTAIWIGVGVFVITLMSTSMIAIVIPIGAIGWGLSVYYKGMVQEKLWEEKENKAKSKFN